MSQRGRDQKLIARLLTLLSCLLIGQAVHSTELIPHVSYYDDQMRRSLQVGDLEQAQAIARTVLIQFAENPEALANFLSKTTQWPLLKEDVSRLFTNLIPTATLRWQSSAAVLSVAITQHVRLEPLSMERLLQALELRPLLWDPNFSDTAEELLLSQLSDYSGAIFKAPTPLTTHWLKRRQLNRHIAQMDVAAALDPTDGTAIEIYMSASRDPWLATRWIQKIAAADLKFCEMTQLDSRWQTSDPRAHFLFKLVRAELNFLKKMSPYLSLNQLIQAQTDIAKGAPDLTVFGVAAFERWIGPLTPLPKWDPNHPCPATAPHINCIDILRGEH